MGLPVGGMRRKATTLRGWGPVGVVGAGHGAARRRSLGVTQCGASVVSGARRFNFLSHVRRVESRGRFSASPHRIRDPAVAVGPGWRCFRGEGRFQPSRPPPRIPIRPARWLRLRNRYVLDRELGRGGMATVYPARDLKHDRPVALKVLRPELAATLDPDRFRREVHLAAGSSTPRSRRSKAIRASSSWWRGSRWFGSAGVAPAADAGVRSHHACPPPGRGSQEASRWPTRWWPVTSMVGS